MLDALEAGVQSGVIQDEDVTLAKLEGFLSGYGRAFYRVPDKTGERIVLTKGGADVIDVLRNREVEVVPFRSNEKTWSLAWK